MNDKANYKLLLASGSPRRADILKIARIPFDVHPVRVDESFIGNDPSLNARRIAGLKAREAVDIFGTSLPVLAADTFIYKEPYLIGKPADREDAERILRLFSGTAHFVYTGYCIYDPAADSYTDGCEITKIEFLPLSEDDIVRYLSSGEWKDAAGGYRIQGYGACYINSITGSFHNVMGLPIHRIYGILRRINFF